MAAKTKKKDPETKTKAPNPPKKYASSGWGDEDIAPGKSFTALEWYKGKNGCKDYLRFLRVPGTNGPVVIHRHWNGRGYVNCTDTPDCPACLAFGANTKQKRHALAVMHIGRRAKGSKVVTRVDKVLRFVFANSIYCQIRDDIVADLEDPDNPDSIHDVNIAVGCVDETKNDYNLTVSPKSKPEPDEEAMDAWDAEGYKEYLRWLDDDFTATNVASHIANLAAKDAGGGGAKKSSGRDKPSYDKDEDDDEDLGNIDDDIDDVVGDL